MMERRLAPETCTHLVRRVVAEVVIGDAVTPSHAVIEVVIEVVIAKKAARSCFSGTDGYTVRGQT